MDSLFQSGGIEVLCETNVGGRPRTAAAKPVPPTGKLKQPPKSKKPDPKREEIEEFKSRVVAQIEAWQNALQEEAKARKAEPDQREAEIEAELRSISTTRLEILVPGSNDGFRSPV